MRLRAAVLSVAALGALTAGAAGCGDSPAPVAGDAVAPTIAASTGPAARACADVWAAGNTLPGRYAGCLLDGHLVSADHQSCSSGQVLVTYDNAFYAVTGGPVQHVKDLSHSPVYKKIIRACNG